MKTFLLSLKPETPNSDYWDYALLMDLIKDSEKEEVAELPKADRAIVVIPARHHAGLEDQINEQLKNIDHAVLFLMGDEEADFDIEKIKHNSIHIWVQNPHIGKHDNYNRIGTGYTPHIKELKNTEIKKEVDLFFAGQNTHERRFELIRILRKMESNNYDIHYHASEGFTQGLQPKDYIFNLSKAKIAPAPSGAVIPDSFRLFEALECMCLVIADQKTPSGEVMEYWDWLFNQITPFYKTDSWEKLPWQYNELLEDYPANLHKQTAWWLKYKRDLKLKIKEQYYA